MLDRKAKLDAFDWGTRQVEESVHQNIFATSGTGAFFQSRQKTGRKVAAVVLLAMILPSGIATAGSRAHSAEGYDRAIRNANSALVRRDYGVAEVLLRRLYKKYPGNQEVLSLMVRSYCEQKKYLLAENLYRKIPFERRHPELKQASLQCRYQHKIQLARHASGDGDFNRTIAIAAPLYKRGVNSYQTGLLVASAYMHLGNIGKAASMYAQLHRQFPGDIEIARQVRRLRDIQAIHAAKNLLSQGNAPEAIVQVKPVYNDSETNFRYDAGMLLAEAYNAQGDIGRALRVYRALLVLHPGNTTLKKKYAQLTAADLVGRSKVLMAKKDYSGAIQLLKPHYDASKPSYDLGMALAHAYMGDHNPGKAASLYGELQTAYPDDHELPELRLRALLAARRYPDASRIYDSLAPGRQQAIDRSLGYEARHLYLYSASVGAQYVKDSNGYPNEQLYELRLKAVTRIGTFVGHFQNEHRFNLNADNYRLDYYYGLSRGWYGYLSYAHSPQHSFLADNDYTLSINKIVGPVTVMASYRHLAFTHASDDVYFAGVGFYPTPRLYLISGAFFVPQTSGYSILVEPIWYLVNGELYAYLTAGQIGEQLNVSGAVKRTASYSVRIGRKLNITPRFGVSVEAFYEHRANFYNRTGIGFYLTWRW